MAFAATENARRRRDEQARLESEGLRPGAMLSELILMRREQRGDAMRLDFFEWAQRVPEPKTGPLNFEQFPFQPEMYRVFGSSARDVVVRKCTQVGISALTVRWGLYVSDRNGYTVLYVFPTEGDVYDFCLPASERVLMADGTTRSIRDVRVGDRVLTAAGGRVVEDEVVATTEPGEKPILRLAIRGGRRVRCTAEHRLLTPAGWVEAGALAPGDEVLVPLELPSGVRSLPPGDPFLMALWLAEGSKTTAGFKFTNAMAEVRDRARREADGRGWTWYEAERHTVCLTMSTRRDDGAPCGFLRRYGLRGMKTDTCKAPDELMTANDADVREFLATYIACDGHVARNEVSIASASERMVRDIRLLAARVGLVGTVRSVQPRRPGALRSWTLAFAGAENLRRLSELAIPGKPVEERERRGEMSRPTVRRAGALGWAKVQEVVSDGEEETFDLTTREHHSFLLEDALTHNSDARVDPMVDASEYLSDRRGQPWNKGLKRMGVGLVYFRGSENKRGLDSVDADALALDEYDTLNQSNIPDAERRLSGVMSAGLIRRVGVPSLPEYGIAARYDESDRRKWLVRCGSCPHTGEDQETKEELIVPDDRGGWQELSFWRNVDEEREAIVCQWCGEPLDVGEGQWVAQQPDGELPGFHVSRLIVPRMQLRGIIKSSKATAPYDVEVFYNKDLGLPYVAEQSRLSPEAIHAAQSAAESFFGYPLSMQEGYDGLRPVSMGVDMASERAMSVRVSEHLDEYRKRALWIGEVDDPDELVNLMNRFRVAMAVVDAAPEARIARGLAARFPGRVYVCRYTTDAKQPITVNDDTWDVTVDRTVAIDATVELVRRQHNLLPAVLPDGYVAEMTANVRRVKVLDETTGKVRVVWEATRKDDYKHAEVYDLVATELYWRRMGIDEMTRETFQQLDQLMPFQRSSVNDLDDQEWQPGPDESFDAGLGTDAMYEPEGLT